MFVLLRFDGVSGWTPFGYRSSSSSSSSSFYSRLVMSHEETFIFEFAVWGVRLGFRVGLQRHGAVFIQTQQFLSIDFINQQRSLHSLQSNAKKKRGKKRKEKRKQEEKKMATDLEEFFDVVVGLGRCFHEVGAPSFGLLLALSVRQFPRLGLIAFVAHQHQRHILQRTLFPSIVKPKLFRSHGRYTKLNLFIQSMHRAEEIPSHFLKKIHLFICCLHHWIIFSRLMVQEKNLNKSFSFLFFSFLFFFNEKRLSDSVGSANWQLRAEEISRSPVRYPQANKFQLFLGRSKFQSSFNVIESTKTLFMSSISVFIINNFSSIYHWKKKGKKKKQRKQN